MSRRAQDLTKTMQHCGEGAEAEAIRGDEWNAIVIAIRDYLDTDRLTKSNASAVLSPRLSASRSHEWIGRALLNHPIDFTPEQLAKIVKIWGLE